ncbi:hypothetical protein GOD68_26695 [Sinorhizobium medicae]|nr:hypothetical protein [Sinorhizobium medicae]MDX0672606.1 hypothetical protein [Sinorhizobium medicae]MDX0709857.1 hypothetical protein [Sinorhizobium medicae]
MVKLTVIAEVEYRAWTDDEKLRHASFKGIRERADEATVFELVSASTQSKAENR